MTSAKRFAKIIFMIMLVLIPVSGICGCGSVQQEKTEQKEIHVSAAGSDETGEGTKDAPYATVSAAAKASPGSVIFRQTTPEVGLFCAAEVIPARLGGRTGSADNQVVVPKAAAALKEHCEDLVEALYIMKRVEHYDCKITYENGRPNYLFLEATAGDRRTFRDSISLGKFQ